MSVSGITIDHSGKVEPKRGDALACITQRLHPFTCPNRGDGKHAERGDGRDLGELSWKPDLNAHVCLDCGYRQDRVPSIQAERYQAANALARLEAWLDANNSRWFEGWITGFRLLGEDLRVSEVRRSDYPSLSAAIHAALDAWEAKT